MVGLGRIADQTADGTGRRDVLDEDFTFIDAVLDGGCTAVDTAEAAAAGALLDKFAVVVAADDLAEDFSGDRGLGGFGAGLAGNTGKVVVHAVLRNHGAFAVVVAVLDDGYAVLGGAVAVASADDTADPDLLGCVMGRVREVSGDGALVGTVGHRGALGRSDDTADIVAGRNLGRILAEDGHGALVDAVFRGRVDEDADDAGRHDEHVEVGDARVLDGYRTGMGQGDGSGVLVALEGAALLDGDDAADDRARQGAGAGHGYGRLVGDVGDGTGGVAGERGELVLGSRVIRIEALREGALDGEVLDGTGERSEERGGGGDILQGVARSVEGTGEGGGPGDLDILEVDVLGEGDGRRLRRQFGRDIDPGCEIIRIVQAQRVGEGHGFGRGAVRIGELRSFVAARAEGLDAELVGLLGPQARRRRPTSESPWHR